MWLLPNNSTFTIFYDISSLPEKYHGDLIEIESLPEGEGILRRAEDGTFYYEPFLEPTPIEPVEPIEPEQPVEPVETIDDKFARLEQLIQTDNLTTFEVLATMYEEIGTNTMTQFDVMATMYEEILALREEVAELKGGTST